ncbi:hypothetical protein E1B28_001479 [Marasmius oreades]|uniref:CASTOR ACT domain-containing protein n=1 Tax=Marasmius oreades TaxID=181124 RepID=A0A9P7V3H9_9AGAR|nr:uncharacterized protein E1B28_001479 [Marasmius oreades]KAG7099653.1 hypothetical protein E1B28_001479 [Marasmius oreades]
MAPPVNRSSLHLHVLPDLCFVVQMDPTDAIPPMIVDSLSNNSSKLLSITRTSEEISIAGAWQEGYPEKFKPGCTWRCIKIVGPMDFGLVGVIAQFTEPLKAIGCPVFVTSTWNTDYIMVPKEKLSKAVETLKTDGWVFAYSLT